MVCINSKYITGLKWLWAILDNVPFQYGSSKIWKHGEAYYGLSNGIGFFPSILNFGWLKIGIVDAHINVINAIINYIRIYVEIKFDYYFRQANPNENKHENPVWLNSLKWWLFYTLVNDIQLLSFKFFNCVKIKIMSIGAFVAGFITDCYIFNDDNEWYFNFNFEKGRTLTVSKNYLILSPRIEINISGIINYFKKK